MPRKKPRFHSLKKLNIRQDWSRWSLYAISQLKPPNLANRTYFQQKWTAKAATRAYHGEQVREKKWTRQFRRDLPAVVPMDHHYLAATDGSEQAAGRGAGADKAEQRKAPRQTPYMQMTYYPLERRLDTAIWRALFASSVRQARQFVVHGLVKVNGKKMVYPGYHLNPGDMFQVEPSSVMYATGAPKKQSSGARKTAKAKRVERAEEREKNPQKFEENELLATQRAEEPTPQELKRHLQGLMEQTDALLAEDVKAKDKQKFRAFRQSIKRAISLWKSASPESVSTLDAQLEFLREQIAARSTPSNTTTTTTDDPAPLISQEDSAKLRAAFAQLRLEAETTSAWNRHNPAAPYATPWRPRDYMSAFAFIPRYLEVNQNVCAAVYLRHPVARPGLAEVPTPFSGETGQLAFNWYLRRR